MRPALRLKELSGNLQTPVRVAQPRAEPRIRAPRLAALDDVERPDSSDTIQARGVLSWRGTWLELWPAGCNDRRLFVHKYRWNRRRPGRSASGSNRRRDHRPCRLTRVAPPLSQCRNSKRSVDQALGQRQTSGDSPRPILLTRDV